MPATATSSALRGELVPVISFDKSVVVAAVAGSKPKPKPNVGGLARQHTLTSIIPSSSVGGPSRTTNNTSAHATKRR